MGNYLGLESINQSKIRVKRWADNEDVLERIEEIIKHNIDQESYKYNRDMRLNVNRIYLDKFTK